MKFQSFTYLCLLTILVIAASILVASPVAAQLIETTFYVNTAADSGLGSLRQAILSANASLGADMIQIAVDGELSLESPLPMISESVTITAGGYSFIIDGASQFRIFEVPAGVRLELIQLELVSGTGGDGNGGAVWNAGVLEVQDCTFLANFAELGGAIYNEGTAHLGAGSEILSSNAVQGAGIYNLGTLSMEETSFSANNASLQGGAIYNLGSLTILGGEFSSGFASDGAGIYSLRGNLTINGSVFWDLETNTTGGAIYANGPASLQDVTLGENHSVQGGALYLGANAIAELIDSSFAGHQAETGGAIRNEGALTISNTSISGSHALGNGGGLFNTGELTLSNVIMVQNIADGDGGGLYNAITGTIAMQAVTLQENEARAGGGLSNAGSLESNGDTYTKNYSRDSGGAIHSTGTLILTGSQVAENESGWEGGGVYNTGTLTMNEVTLLRNHAEDGGGMVNQGTAVINGGRFERNDANTDLGGGIANLRQGSLDINGTIFERNFVHNMGGAIFSYGTLAIQDAVFHENSAKWGGAIDYWGTETASITGTTFTGNGVGHYGGAIINHASLELEDCTFTENMGYDFGGAVHNEGNLTIHRVTFTGNHVEQGSGGAVENWGTASIEASTFENNHAMYDGGAINSGLPASSLTLSDVSFSNNQAEEGGAIYNSSGLILSNVTFTGNIANSDGGAIYNQGSLEIGSSASFNDTTTFTGNTAGHNGGAISNLAGLELHYSTFTENTSHDFGGALHNEGELAASWITFTGNHVDQGSGGAMENWGIASIEHSTFENNLATNGGAIHAGLPGSELTLIEVAFTQNEAEDGGAIYNEAALNLISSDFTENHANNRGNGIYNQGVLEASGCFFDRNGSYSRHPEEGGAVYNATAASASFSNTVFDLNFAWYNGGAIASYGPLVVTGSDFTNNLALDQGGAIYQVGGTASLQDTNFWGNETWNYAGAIASYNTDMHILRCLIAHSYSWSGGAIISGGTLLIENSTLAYNLADDGGAAIKNYATTTLAYSTVFGNSVITNELGGVLENYASLTVSNSIIAGTSDGYNCTGGVARSGPNISDDYSCAHFTVTDPRLGPLQDNGGPTFTHALLWNSPALDAAAGACPLTDQREVARPQGPACDLGAFEASPFVVGIDIAPKSKDNLIHLSSPGSVSVAVLSVQGFYAPTVVDRASLRFGATGTENPPLTVGSLGKLSCSAGDINGDGLADLVCKFAIPGTNFTCSSQVGLLSGLLQNGDTFTSQDRIRPYPCP